MYAVAPGRASFARVTHRIALSACGILLSCAAVASASASNEIEASYRAERTSCAMRPEGERAACLREAAAAREAARKGRLSVGGQADYEKNALQRCAALPAADRNSCERRARGEGQVSGSIESGGVIREYREVILPPSPPPQPAPAADLTPPAAQDAVPLPASQVAPAGTMLQTR